jgi:large subunit ribosomal protein L9
MKVVFLEDVEGVAQGGEVKDVKNGFARNYLIPQRLAVLSTREALKRVERLNQQAHQTRLKTLVDLRVLGELLDGARVNVAVRVGASGRLYGSVTNTIVAGELGKLAGREIDRRSVELPESIREVGTHDVRVRLHPEVSANITVLVYPGGSDPEEFLVGLMAAQEEEAAKKRSEEEGKSEVSVPGPDWSGADQGLKEAEQAREGG